MTSYYPPCPELDVAEWINTPEPVRLAALRGRVVLLHAFQMLCPGCITHGLPQAVRVSQAFAPGDVAVIGLHTVFEHHAVMTPAALRAFAGEFRYRFPIGIDRPRPGESIPATMHALQLGGTPSAVLLDREGRVRLHHLGQIEDLALGACIGRLLAETPPAGAHHGTPAGDNADEKDCGPSGCRIG
ncbi:MAG TPA: TlpA disulfide reductase family protein [Noviherbaspirillum sp.]|uniref:peroxiredoxin family protein n=1 Tax=Noviherbaspirillum sp. TaxID=1926288 RepID=UPI002D3F3CCF|nr:TlpA disulfide reductase family protein [Noviherbaspirillum sp.]HYD94898.1 TlpA disulfide reductase family protein [Noviherbaspirillum sp.]